MLSLIFFFVLIERFLLNFDKLSSITLFDFINGPIFLKMKENNILLIFKPNNFDKMKKKYTNKASNKYLIILIIKNF